MHVGPEEVRAWIQYLCARELAEQRQLVAMLGGQGATASGQRTGSPSRGGVPVPVAGAPARARVAASRGRAPLFALGAVCLLLAGALGAVLLMPAGRQAPAAPVAAVAPVQAGTGSRVDAPVEVARADAPVSAGQNERAAVTAVQAAGGEGAGAAEAAMREEAGGEGAGATGAAMQEGQEGEGGGASVRLANAQQAGADGASAEPPAPEPALAYALVTVDTVYEVMEDRGEHYLRAGSANGVDMGTEVQVVGPAAGDGRRPLYGTAVVMELKSERMARVRLDKAPPEGSTLFASFTPPPPKETPRATARRQEPRAAPAPAARARVDIAAPVAIAESEPPPLQGRVELGGFGPMKRLTLYNREQRAWTHCDLRLPNNKR
jgi:hypothetical protein